MMSNKNNNHLRQTNQQCIIKMNKIPIITIFFINNIYMQKYKTLKKVIMITH